ncbi:MAG TPA: SPOR domain-containing protein [Balneolaceae bacterium]
MNISNKYVLIFSALTFLLVASCSTTKQTTQKGPSAPDSASSSFENITSLDFLLFMSRSSLSDLHTYQQHDMPVAFLKDKSDNEVINTDPFDGYRIQLISTKDVQLADSIANDFRIWSDTTIAGYTAQAYVFFSQPYFKVHVGDFQQREQASSFSQLLEKRYPAAWVVHDRIDPTHVPADTTVFSVITAKDGLKKLSADSLENYR